MKAEARGGEVIALGKDHMEEGAALLVRCFREDPSFRWFFPPGPEREGQLALFCRFMVARAVLAGQPALGIRGPDRTLQGIALAENRMSGFLGGIRDFLVELRLYGTYLRPLGKETLERLGAYRRASLKAQKRRFTMYLVMVGVAPEARGLGYGKSLVKYVQALDRRRAGAEGVALDTEAETNVGLYRHLGFSLEGRAELDGLEIFVFHDHRWGSTP